MSKTLQGHSTKLNKKQPKTTEAPTVSSRGQATVILYSTLTIDSLSNDDRKSTVFSDGAFLTDDGRLFHARAEATGKARSPSVERLVDGATRMTVSAKRRRLRLNFFNPFFFKDTPTRACHCLL